MKAIRLLSRCGILLAAGAALHAAGLTPVRINQTVPLRFPNALAYSTLNSGQARVIISVGADGQLADVLVAGYTDEAFADEAVRALRQWTFAPAQLQGQPVGVRLELKFDFTAPGRVVTMTPVDTPDTLIRMFVPPRLITRVCTPDELDHPVAPIQTVEPVHPGPALPAEGPTGRAVLDFYVDEKGQTRMPVVVRSTDESYTQAAVAALNQWRFAAPTRNGKPVAVRVQQEFIFPGGS